MRNALLGLLLLAAFAVALVFVTTRRTPRPSVGQGGEEAGAGQARVLSLPANLLDEVVRECNRGVALIDRHEFSKAVESWRKVVEAAPQWPTGWVNLGIALLNGQKEYEECERVLRRAIELDSRNPHAHYVLSRLFDYQTRTAEEIAELREVALIDPQDADTHYALGMALRKKAGGQDLPAMEKERLEEEARRELEKAVELNPSHHSAWYVLFQARQRSADRDKAMEALDRFRALDRAGTGDKRSTVYTEMGRYADVVRFFETPPPERPPLEFELVEADPTSLPFAPQGGTAGPLRIDGTYRDRADFLERGASRFGSGCALADFDGDGDLDAALAVCGREGGIRLYRNDAGTMHGVTGESSVGPPFPAMGVYAGDFDNDGNLDLFATGAGAQKLLRNKGAGIFVDATEAGGLLASGRWTLGASLVDVDQDGDLDIFTAGYADLSGLGERPVDAAALPGAPEALYVNRGDATFEEIAVPPADAGGDTRTLSVLAFDIDGDTDADLLALNDGAPNRLHLNDRVLRFREQTPPLLAGPGRRTTGALAWDPDRDGDLDLLLLHGAGAPVEAFRNAGRGRLEADALLSRTLGRATAIGGATFDADNDGDPDLLLTGGERAGGLLFFRNDEAAGFPEETEAVGLQRLAARERRGLCAGDVDGDGAIDLLLSNAGSPPTLLRNDGGSANRWIGIRPRGVRSGKDLRSPAQGIGALVEVKAGRLIGERVLGGGSGYLGSDPDVVHFGLANRESADYVRILWPDGVVQAELDLPAGQVHRIEELQRKASSCPVLFAWDGERFACVTDFLGVGGLGFLVAPGVFGPPDPDENVAIPFPLAEREGMYELRIAEPLEEVTYADAFSLLVWDHPSGVEVIPDERFAAAPPLPTGEPLAIRERIHPVAARREGGEDLLASVLRTDRIYAGPKALASRFLGYAEPHAIELDFGDRARSLAGRAFLFAWGWVEYPYSRINLGASQAGLRMEAPTLEVPDGAGGWKPAIKEFGYPAGLPRWMAVEVTPILREGHTRMRLATNVEVYWDELFLGQVDAAEVRSTALSPSSADLRFCGYPREFSPDGRSPRLYDYALRDRGFPFFRNLPGDYTRLGDVRELVAAVDDRFAIFGRGEEIALRFDPASLPPLPPGWSRSFALRAEGYCKDMDPTTGAGTAVEPLPFRAMSNYPYGPDERYPEDPAHMEYREKWNTRRVGPRAQASAPRGDR